MIDLSGVAWKKSSRSGYNGCVEVALVKDSHVAVRDSKDPGGAALVFTPMEWEAFIGGVMDGEFNITATRG